MASSNLVGSLLANMRDTITTSSMDESMITPVRPHDSAPTGLPSYTNLKKTTNITVESPGNSELPLKKLNEFVWNTTKTPAAPLKNHNAHTTAAHTPPPRFFASSINQVFTEMSAKSAQEADAQADMAFRRTNKRPRTGEPLTTIDENKETPPEHKGMGNSKVSAAGVVRSLSPEWKQTEL